MIIDIRERRLKEFSIKRDAAVIAAVKGVLQSQYYAEEIEGQG